MKLKLKKEKGSCKACGAMDHACGFIGSVYVDCPRKPCFLCRRPGHTTATCPFRLAPEHGVVPAAQIRTSSLAASLQQREASGRRLDMPYVPPKRWRVTAAVIKLHSRRLTAMEFHPTRPIIVSGDKRGQIGLWDFDRVFEKTVIESKIEGAAHGIHSYLVSSIRVRPEDPDYFYSSSVDGTVCKVDIETHAMETVMNLNAMPWTSEMMSEGVLAGETFRMVWKLFRFVVSSLAATLLIGTFPPRRRTLWTWGSAALCFAAMT